MRSFSVHLVIWSEFGKVNIVSIFVQCCTVRWLLSFFVFVLQSRKHM